MLENLAQNGRDVAAKLFGIFAHREVAEFFHDGDPGAADRRRGPPRVVRGAGKIIFAGEQIKRARAGVDLLKATAQIAIDPVEVQIATGAGVKSMILPPRMEA